MQKRHIRDLLQIENRTLNPENRKDTSASNPIKKSGIVSNEPKYYTQNHLRTHTTTLVKKKELSF